MHGRWGLQAKMTASYAGHRGGGAGRGRGGRDRCRADLGADRATHVQLLASATANQVMQQSATSAGCRPPASSTRPGPQGLPPGLAREPADETGGGPPDLLQRQRGAPRRGGGAAASARRAGGGQLRPGPLPGRQAAGRPAMGALPAQITSQPPTARGKRDGLTPTPTRVGAVLWTAAPVLDLRGLDKGTKPSPVSDLLGVVYVQIPATAKLAEEPNWRGADAAAWRRAAGPGRGRARGADSACCRPGGSSAGCGGWPPPPSPSPTATTTTASR